MPLIVSRRSANRRNGWKKNPTTPSRYNVRSIPTLLLFKNGQVAATKIGAEPKQKLVSWINTAIA